MHLLRSVDGSPSEMLDFSLFAFKGMEVYQLPYCDQAYRTYIAYQDPPHQLGIYAVGRSLLVPLQLLLTFSHAYFQAKGLFGAYNFAFAHMALLRQVAVRTYSRNVWVNHIEDTNGPLRSLLSFIFRRKIIPFVERIIRMSKHVVC